MVTTSGGANGKRGNRRIISPLVQPDTRSARVIAEFDNKTMIWHPGATDARVFSFIGLGLLMDLGNQPRQQRLIGKMRRNEQVKQTTS
jgi:hypothetical protein